MALPKALVLNLHHISLFLVFQVMTGFNVTFANEPFVYQQIFKLDMDATTDWLPLLKFPQSFKQSFLPTKWVCITFK